MDQKGNARDKKSEKQKKLFEKMKRTLLVKSLEGAVPGKKYTVSILFLKFLFRRGWQGLNDGGLTKLGNTMLVFFVLYMIGFTFLLLSILNQNAS